MTHRKNVCSRITCIQKCAICQRCTKAKIHRTCNKTTKEHVLEICSNFRLKNEVIIPWSYNPIFRISYLKHVLLLIQVTLHGLIVIQYRPTKRHFSGHALALRPWCYRKKLAISPGLLPRLYGTHFI